MMQDLWLDTCKCMTGDQPVTFRMQQLFDAKR